MPKSIKDLAIECNSSSRQNLDVQYVKRESDLIRVSNMIGKPIITVDHKEYMVLDGNIAYVCSMAIGRS